MAETKMMLFWSKLWDDSPLCYNYVGGFVSFLVLDPEETIVLRMRPSNVKRATIVPPPLSLNSQLATQHSFQKFKK
jgi:hypothetical protein